MPTIQHQTGTCKRCGGRIFRRTWNDGQARGDWLHLYEADWVDDPHPARPAPLEVP